MSQSVLTTASAVAKPMPSSMRQIPLPLGPDPAQEFSNFIAGDPASGNAQAHEHLARGALLAAPAYLWGDSGTGKTHLLSAAANRVAAADGHVVWLGPRSRAPWPQFGAAGPGGAGQVLVIDDVDSLDADQQHAAFALLAQAPTLPAAVLAAGPRPLVDLPLREDLRTRLAQGLVFRLEALDDAGMRQALAAEARRRGLPLSDEVTHYLLTRFARDLKSLMALLQRLDSFALARRRALTVPLLKQMVEEEKLSP